MLASFMLLLSVDFNAVSWEGVKFRGRACQAVIRNFNARANYGKIESVNYLRSSLKISQSISLLQIWAPPPVHRRR
jgi:hypothetical protein